jgi:hypothetical protein
MSLLHLPCALVHPHRDNPLRLALNRSTLNRREPQDHVAVALPRPAHGAETAEDGRFDHWPSG